MSSLPTPMLFLKELTSTGSAGSSAGPAGAGSAGQPEVEHKQQSEIAEVGKLSAGNLDNPKAVPTTVTESGSKPESVATPQIVNASSQSKGVSKV